MSAKTMIFIDGSWFYRCRKILFDTVGENGFEIDYRRIPELIQDTLSDMLDLDVDVVRTIYFGTLPTNRHGFSPAKQSEFYEFLSEQCNFESRVIEVDHKVDQDSDDDHCVGIALASTAMRYAMTPGAFDIATIVGGKFEYVSLLKELRNCGKRTFLTSFRNKPGQVVASQTLTDTHSLCDFPTLFLNEHAQELKLVREEVERVCKLCGNKENTTWAGPDFFCSKCRNDHHKKPRECAVCHNIEETSWDKDPFVCSRCRKERKFPDA